MPSPGAAAQSGPGPWAAQPGLGGAPSAAGPGLPHSSLRVASYNAAPAVPSPSVPSAKCSLVALPDTGVRVTRRGGSEAPI